MQPCFSFVAYPLQEQRECCFDLRILVSLHLDIKIILWQARRRGRQEQLCAYIRAY
jgi:hypothetical protein